MVTLQYCRTSPILKHRHFAKNRPSAELFNLIKKHRETHRITFIHTIILFIKLNNFMLSNGNRIQEKMV